jgi:hypothetical protein
MLGGRYTRSAIDRVRWPIWHSSLDEGGFFFFLLLYFLLCSCVVLRSWFNESIPFNRQSPPPHDKTRCPDVGLHHDHLVRISASEKKGQKWENLPFEFDAKKWSYDSTSRSPLLFYFPFFLWFLQSSESILWINRTRHVRVIYIGDVLIGLLRQPGAIAVPVPSQKESLLPPQYRTVRAKTNRDIFYDRQHVTRYRSVILSLYIVGNEIRAEIGHATHNSITFGRKESRQIH